MFMLRVLAPSVLISLAVVVMLLGPAMLYILARWRAHASPTPDPHLGLKFALYWFATSALQLGLMGLAMFVYALIGPGSSAAKGELYRIAFAAIVPAGILLGLHLLMLKRTNDEEVPGVRRLFLGYNFIIAGLIGFSAFAGGFQVLFAKGSSHGTGRLLGSLVLVYGTAWALVGWRLGQLVAGGYVAGTSAPGAAPPVDPLAPGGGGGGGGGGGLPALGGGSFPPIEQKQTP